MKIFNILLFLFLTSISFAQVGTNGEDRKEDGRPIKEYNLTVEKNEITIVGKTKKDGMTINGSIPGPTLEFNEGDLAIINVTNKMDVETSVHWHGLILPNFYDGVPYLTTPPILSGETFQYRIPINQSGTYWYHSHTNLQEQEGVYGSIVIHPKTPRLDYDSELVIVLSDWTHENANKVLKNLKRHLEWYSIKRNTPQPLIPSIAKGLLAERFILYKNRMPDMHIADVYYDAFLSNGKPERHYPRFKKGEKVRLRVINASASTYFWLNATSPFKVISADGIDVEPVIQENVLMAIAETYDFIVQIPEDGMFHFQASAQDGSGTTSVYLGEGDIQLAPQIDAPDYYELMDKVAQLHKKGGHTGHLKKPYTKIIPPSQTPDSINQEHTKQMDEMQHQNHHEKANQHQDASKMKHQDHQVHTKKMVEMQHQNHREKTNQHQDASEMKHQEHREHTKKMVEMQHQNHREKANQHQDASKMKHQDHQMMEPNVTTSFNYDFLKSIGSTEISANKPTREIMMNLNANMLRYVWMIDGKVLSQEDKIPVKKGEKVRFIMNNNTMMHHPMHLHGHYFRVLNINGEYSPLKHTVDIPPFESVIIEFDANEEGDWFFHCHVLYHMMAGMARVVSYNTPRSSELAPYPYHKILHHDKRYFHWFTTTIASNMTSLEHVSSNTNNVFVTNASYGWNENFEIDLRYERYITNFTRLVGGINTENEFNNSLDEVNVTGYVGIRNQLLSILDAGINIDNQLRPELELEWHVGLLKRLFLTGHYEWVNDFNFTQTLDTNKSYEAEHTVTVGFEYIINQYIGANANYDNRYGWGTGLSIRF